MKFVSESPAKTRRIATELARKILKCDSNKAFVIALEGELGAGKTVFAKGFAKAVGVNEKVTSPTFVIMKRFILHTSRFMNLYHIDAYRLTGPRDLASLGLSDIFLEKGSIILIEWPERLGRFLPRKLVRVHIDHLGPKTRKIEIKGL